MSFDFLGGDEGDLDTAQKAIQKVDIKLRIKMTMPNMCF